MGRDLYEASPSARFVLDEAERILGIPLAALCFEGPEEALRATEYAQPAIFTVSVALLAALAQGADRIVDFTAARSNLVAGHSLGHYTALVAAGALSFPAGLRLVRQRGELMAAARGGGMAAVIGLDVQTVERICREVSTPADPVVIANDNAPGQVVLSGSLTALHQAEKLAVDLGSIYVLPLETSAAFHSPLMGEAATRMATLLAGTAIADPAVPVLSNVTAQPMQDRRTLHADLLEHMRARVRWVASIEYAAAAGITTFAEIGPGQALTGTIRRIVPGSRVLNVGNAVDLAAFAVGPDGSVDEPHGAQRPSPARPAAAPAGPSGSVPAKVG